MLLCSPLRGPRQVCEAVFTFGIFCAETPCVGGVSPLDGEKEEAMLDAATVISLLNSCSAATESLASFESQYSTAISSMDIPDIASLLKLQELQKVCFCNTV